MYTTHIFYKFLIGLCTQTINSQNALFLKSNNKIGWINDSCIFIPVNFKHNFAVVSYISIYVWIDFDFVYILCIIIYIQHQIFN